MISSGHLPSSKTQSTGQSLRNHTSKQLAGAGTSASCTQHSFCFWKCRRCLEFYPGSLGAFPWATGMILRRSEPEHRLHSRPVRRLAVLLPVCLLLAEIFRILSNTRHLISLSPFPFLSCIRIKSANQEQWSSPCCIKHPSQQHLQLTV